MAPLCDNNVNVPVSSHIIIFAVKSFYNKNKRFKLENIIPGIVRLNKKII
jgi:hypothetical protein